jgi:NAD(P)-dependent dehydrogenase (short-subunit alcohol dehydrogenase family)
VSPINRKEVVLVVGARPYSLGQLIALSVNDHAGFISRTAGISELEDRYLDLVTDDQEQLFVAIGNARHVVVTAGINEPWDQEGRQSLDNWLTKHYVTNVVGPMRLWEAFKARCELTGQSGHFVVISSNSARLPRTQSMAYCASKAALSMAVRVAAREAGRVPGSPIIYGYEPGLLRGTPMTSDTEVRLPGVPLTRMQTQPGGIDPIELARMVAHGIAANHTALNGCLIPYDDGEM